MYQSYWAFKMQEGWDISNAFDRQFAEETFERFVQRVTHEQPGWVSEMYVGYVGSSDALRVSYVGSTQHLADHLVRALRLAGELFDERVLRATPRVHAAAVLPEWRERCLLTPELTSLIEAAEGPAIDLYDQVESSSEGLQAVLPPPARVNLRFSANWFAGKIPLFQAATRHLAGKPDIAALEVGTFEGRCACWLLQHVLTHDTAKLTCIDPFEWNTSFEHELSQAGHLQKFDERFSPEVLFDENIRALGAQHKVRKMKGRSRDLLPQLPQHAFDLIYIDGSHRSTDVLSDAVLSWELLKPGGVMIFDDYGLEAFCDARHNPSAAIDAFLSVYGDMCELRHVGYLLTLRKLADTPARRLRTASPGV
jgi:predicted O-methyltransferase YrrM